MLKEIQTRRSTRAYKSTSVDDETIMQIIESARLAPSGKNTQPWNFIIVKSEETRERIAQVNNKQLWMKTAPVFIVCVADIRCRLRDETSISLDETSGLPELKQIIRDTAIAMEHILLEAEHLGLSSYWTAWFTQDEIRPILGIPGDKYVVGVLTIGYAEAEGKSPPRRPIESMIRYEKW